MRINGNYGSTIGYEPNSYNEWQEQPEQKEPPLALDGAAYQYDFREDDNDYYSQPRALFQLFTQEEKERLFSNTAAQIGGAEKFIQMRHIGNCYQADPAYGLGVAKALGISEKEVEDYMAEILAK